MKSNPNQRGRGGFALIITLSLMILLTVVAVGLLGLSGVSLRSTGKDAAASAARSNARLALMMALGELQATMGTDTSVSAPASSVISSPQRPHLTGVWQRPPADPSKWPAWHWTPAPGGAPDYSAKAGLFKRWLVSTAKPADATSFTLPGSAVVPGDSVVTLVGNRNENLSNNGFATVVNAEKIPVTVNAAKGKLAWAVFDDSTKAPIHLGDRSTSPSAGVEIASRTAPIRAHAEVLATTLEASLKAPVNLISMDTAMIPGGAASRPDFRKRFHDFTTHSVGLLTDTANGGLKTDLTALFEPAALNAAAFTRDSPYPAGFKPADGALSWKYLQNHYQKYRNVTVSGGNPSYNLRAAAIRNTDLKINQTGVLPAPEVERLIPVVAKLQIVFSMVAHWVFDVEDRRAFLNNHENNSEGFKKYGAVNLAYDPVVTLYNPYDVSLDLSKFRIRVWDPPVGFRFRKIDKQAGTDVFFRKGGEFLGLGRFQWAAENNVDARKCFTLVLADGDQTGLKAQLLLKPGEVKVFSPRVEKAWTWAYETSGKMSGTRTNAVFFDYDQSLNFGNADRRASSKYGTFGVECAPGWDVRAGLQTDHLANSNGSVVRDPATLYGFEAGRNTGWVQIRNTDDIVAEIKPLVSGNSNINFQVDVLAGVTAGSVSAADLGGDKNNVGVKTDTLRSYKFTFTGKDPSQEMSADPNNPIIDSRFMVGNIMQEDDVKGKGGKTPFAMLEMSARNTKGDLTDGKPWLYNNLVVEGGTQDSTTVGLTHQSYDLRLKRMTSFDGFPGGIAIDPDTNRGYFGANDTVNEGSSFVGMLKVPLAPAASLGDLIPANLASGSTLPRVVHPFGNSRAHPLISASGVAQTLGAATMADHSYLLNDALWDQFYFSSIADYTSGISADARTFKDVLGGVLDGTRPALNTRLTGAGGGASADVAGRMDGLGDVDRSRQLARYLAVSGPFNLNSTSVDAWRSVLSALRGQAINGSLLNDSGSPPNLVSTLKDTSYPTNSDTPFVRFGKPLAGMDPPSNFRWAAFRTLTDGQIQSLAKLIVAEITAAGVQDRAPAFSLGEFVNRRPGSSVQSLAGRLQTAIDKSDINQQAIGLDSKTLNVGSVTAARKKGVQTPAVLDGNSGEGAPTMLTQGDLMGALAAIATVRGDTFKIRAYGESTASDGKTVLARAWCEAVVQRVPEFVDARDEAVTAPAALTSNANKNFGRRFNLVSFRWLKEDEI